jgi:uncharacterized protein
MSEDLDCQSCGACCVINEGGVTVEKYDTTPKYLTRSVRNVMGWASWEADVGVRRMASKDGACIALQRDGSKCSCSIYDRRPKACRLFERGSQECLDARGLLQSTSTADYSEGKKVWSKEA